MREGGERGKGGEGSEGGRGEGEEEREEVHMCCMYMGERRVTNMQEYMYRI